MRVYNFVDIFFCTKSANSEKSFTNFFFPISVLTHLLFQIMDIYIQKLLPKIVDNNDEVEGSFGSTATADIAALQAISKRVHMGKHVAEVLFFLDIFLLYGKARCRGFDFSF